MEKVGVQELMDLHSSLDSDMNLLTGIIFIICKLEVANKCALSVV